MDWDEALEGHVGHPLHAWILGADGSVEAVDGGVVGAGGLVDLLGGWGVVGAAARARRLRVRRLRILGRLGTACGPLRRAEDSYWSGGGALGWRVSGRGVLGSEGGGVGADVAFGGELAAVVDDEFFDFCHGVSVSIASDAV